VLWSSDIWSSFEELASQVPQSVHASMSGIPWWTTDVGGYGCGNNQPNDSDYMRELSESASRRPMLHGCTPSPAHSPHPRRTTFASRASREMVPVRVVLPCVPHARLPRRPERAGRGAVRRRPWLVRRERGESAPPPLRSRARARTIARAHTHPAHPRTHARTHYHRFGPTTQTRRRRHSRRTCSSAATFCGPTSRRSRAM
jgi:hypothetical protein